MRRRQPPTEAEEQEWHSQFITVTRRTDSSRWLVAKYFSRKFMFTTKLAPLRLAPTYGERQLFSDKGDILITKDEIHWDTLEVKQLGYHFTGKHNWPFDKNFLVTSQASFARANPKPLMFVVVSACRRYAATIRSTTSGNWKPVTIRHHHYGGNYRANSIMASIDDVGGWIDLWEDDGGPPVDEPVVTQPWEGLYPTEPKPEFIPYCCTAQAG